VIGIKKIGFILYLFTLFLSFSKTNAQLAKPPYPIIFVHGLDSNDKTWTESINQIKSIFNIGDVQVFNVVLNAYSGLRSIEGPDGILGTIDDDVLTLYKDEAGNSVNNLLDGVLFAINFENFWNEDENDPRIKLYNSGSPGFLGIGESDGNESSIIKQGYALKRMIEKVLSVTNSEKVILVGHSMGGLAIREYLQRTINNDNTSEHRWWVKPNEPDGHRVAKVVTIGTPHGGSNYWNIPLLKSKDNKVGTKKKNSSKQNNKSLFPNLNSEAVRDLRYNYITLTSSAPNPSSDDGVYLFGGTEMNLSMLANGYHNYDINGDGNETSTIIGINSWKQGNQGLMYVVDNPQMPLPDIPYVWITSLENYNSSVKDGDGVVRLDRQYLLTPGDTLKTYFYHTDESKDYYSIIRGLDEPNEIKYAYKINPNEKYIGSITTNTNNSENDLDYYSFKLLKPSTVSIKIENAGSGVKEFTLMDKNTIFIGSALIGSFPFKSEKYNLSTGIYYLKIRGIANGKTWQNPYQYKVEITPIGFAADFQTDVISGQTPLTVKFTDKSTGTISSREWDFNNDGVVDSYLQNPVYTYSVPGVYSVRLTVFDGTNTQTELKENLITVNEVFILTKLTEAEYFFDTEPGFGIGTKIALTNTPNFLVDTKLNISSLNEGIHILGLRVKDENGKWSFTYYKFFLKEHTGYNEIKDIVQGEYFFDTDPGFDNGKTLSIAQGANITLSEFLDVTGLPEGIHTLNIRFKDSAGNWTKNFTKMFLKVRYLNNENVVITNIEYYIDQDPGYDLATSVPVISASNIEKNFSVDLSSVSKGIHTFFLRAKDNYNVWSQIYTKTFIKESFSTTKTLKRLEYFVDNDPGYGNGISIGNISSKKDSVSFLADLKNVSSGIHIFNCRVQDTEDKWSLSYSKMFLIDNNSQGKSITTLEYFFDLDPGYGKGNKVNVSPSGEIEIQFNADIKLLTSDKHNLFIRVKDSGGTWSFVTGRVFEKIAMIITAQIRITSGWNIVSVPIISNEMKKDSLFKDATSSAFSFRNGYTVADTLVNGKGYWLKFSSTNTVLVEGTYTSSSTIPVNSGWNLIGGYDRHVITNSLTSTPSGIISSSFFGYDNGYFIPDTLKGGKGYWLKANQDGVLNITSSLAKGKTSDVVSVNTINQDWGRIIVSDAKGKSSVLYMGKDIGELNGCI